METALVFFASQTMETAVADSARLIMTGQAQAASFGGADKFKEAVCAKIGGLFNCQAGLYVDVKTYPKFADVNNSQPSNPTAPSTPVTTRVALAISWWCG